MDERVFAKKMMLWAGIAAAVLSVALAVLMLINFPPSDFPHGDFPSCLWTPYTKGDFVRGFLFALLFVAIGIVLMGVSVLIKDWEILERGWGEQSLIHSLVYSISMVGLVLLLA